MVSLKGGKATFSAKRRRRFLLIVYILWIISTNFLPSHLNRTTKWYCVTWFCRDLSTDKVFHSLLLKKWHICVVRDLKVFLRNTEQLIQNSMELFSVSA